MSSLSKLLKTGKTVFSTRELASIWGVSDSSAKTITTRKVKKNELYGIKRGYFALTKGYNNFELGCKMFPGSYISSYTALKEYGVIFQEFKTIYLVGPRAKLVKIGDKVFEYHSIKNLIFFGKGIVFHDNYSIATVERAILDSFFLFDTDFSDFSIAGLDKTLFLELADFYNKKIKKKAEKFLKYFKL